MDLSSIISSPTQDHLESGQIPTQSSWIWNPFQKAVLLREEFEIALLGGKYSGKSSVARGFLLNGNPSIPGYDPSGHMILPNFSYIYHPNYRATILRRNQSDLDDFVRKFEVLVRPLGGVFTRGLFEFPSGAVIAAGHLADRDSWQKYIGVENVRFVVEEATLLPEFELFDQIRSCCRSIYPEMRAQILLTSNFGGPGQQWVVARYIEVDDPDGNRIPAGTTIHEVVKHPDFPDQSIDRTRVWMFSTYRDNPYAVKDVGYIGTLATMSDPKLRAAYLDGDWTCFAGIYFNQWDEKLHTIPPNPSLLQSYWYRTGSIDVGFTHETAVYWCATDPTNQQEHFYRELVTSGTPYVQIGYEIASRSIPELEALSSHSMIFWISPDAIQRRSEQKSIAELLMAGIARKLGPKAVHFPELEMKEFHDLAQGQFLNPYDEQEKWTTLFSKLKSQRQAGITLRIAPNDRVIGWQYMREAMRTTPVGDILPPYDPDLARELFSQSVERFLAYEQVYRNASKAIEVLPKLQVWRSDPSLPLWGCPRLIEAIPKARHAEGPGKNPEDIEKTHFKGMDSIDSARYLLLGKREVKVEEPREAWMERHTQEALSRDPGMDHTAMLWLNRHLEEKWDTEKKGSLAPFTMPRKSKVMRMGGPAAYASAVQKLLGGSKQ